MMRWMFQQTEGWHRWAGWRPALAVLVLAAGLIGCGGPSGPTAPTTRLEGMVRLDGQPVADGFISFFPQQKKQAPPAKADIRDGRYAADKVPVGPVLVMIRSPKKTGKVETIPDSKSQYEEVVETIPRKYLAGIPLDVTENLKTQDFDLSSK